jgi:acetyl esterase/lipase
MEKLISVVLIGIVMALMMLFTGFTKKDANRQIEMGNYSYINANDSVPHILNHPAFKGFGRFILPVENNRSYEGIRLNNINSLLPYHSHINTKTTVSVINQMIDEINGGKKMFYDFYSEQEKQRDTTKKSTGLFFFRGNPGAPFAVICPGGGFAYVGSIHEGFPYAVELSSKGYNAFVLNYRVGSGLTATRDLAAAVSYIFKNARMFDISTEHYSLWGSSAGARMVANIASNGAAGFGGSNLPDPKMIVMAYTGHSAFSENDPPTFVTVSDDDPIVNVSIIENRIKNMRKAEIEVEYRKYKNAGHGFGLGIGTNAEGWIEHAIQFWEKQMPE